ncbi:MAG: GSCFA domain-containing protein [Rhodospirillaceae bacterium]|nr:GSCFA domain-containing protein [Rhodospirillaceae bacterium]
MGLSLKDISDRRLLKVYEKWLGDDKTNWIVGLTFLLEISKRLGTAFSKEDYFKGLQKIVGIKPALHGRAYHYFPADFAIPVNEIEALFQETEKDVGIAVAEPGNALEFYGSKSYVVPAIDSIEQFGEQVAALLKDVAPQFTQHASGRLLTFGSCFAVNVGQYLRKQGNSVYTLVVAEDVNSPFNNLQLLKRVFRDERTPVAEELELINTLNFDDVKREFLEAERIVFTLGNIFHLEIDGCSTIHLKKGSTLIAERFEETVKYLREIFTLLRENTRAKIFVSVSPIPIGGYRGDQFKTAIEADCVSKSQLRAALHACQNEFEGLIYVPTFEIFRWLPAHQSFATFGVDDGVARHISTALLTKVMEQLAGKST